MTCPDCEARARMMRDDLLNAKIAQAAGHVVTGAAEMLGLKPKTGAQELEAREIAPTKPVVATKGRARKAG